MKHIYNFSAGPAMVEPKVLQKAYQEFFNWQNKNVSVMEVSHRSVEFMQLVSRTEQNLRNLLNIPANYKVLFLPGGAFGQFAALPLNLLSSDEKALYLITGHWSQQSANEASKFGDVTSLDLQTEKQGKKALKIFDLGLVQNYKYVHFCSNETISGLFFDPTLENNQKINWVSDMSSELLSREIDISKFALIYACTQKNIGIAGLTIVIVRDDLLKQHNNKIPAILDYQAQLNRDSMLNTPATFSWYLCDKVLEFLLENDNLKQIHQQNKLKAKFLYDYLDQSNFYHNAIDAKFRSIMNVSFSTNDAELDTKFIKEAEKQGLLALKGHKVQAGMRASIYNAMPLKGVQTLIEFMENFAKVN